MPGCPQSSAAGAGRAYRGSAKRHLVIDRTSHRHALSFAILVASAATPPAFAQTGAPAPNRTHAPSGQGDEVTDLASLKVTAQKREEVLQDVPTAPTALPEPLLRDTGVRDIKDVQILVPGLTVTSTQSEAQTTARIRGIRTVGDNAGLE